MDSASKIAPLVIMQVLHQVKLHVNYVIQYAKAVEIQATVKFVYHQLLLFKMEFVSKKIHAIQLLLSTLLLLAIVCLVSAIVRYANQLQNAKFA